LDAANPIPIIERCILMMRLKEHQRSYCEIYNHCLIVAIEEMMNLISIKEIYKEYLNLFVVYLGLNNISTMILIDD
jgi:hypothetical protein